MKLTDKKDEVKTAVLNAKPGEIITLKGYAGTGKTATAAEIIADFSNTHGLFGQVPVLVAAPTAAAVAVLKSKLASKSLNIAFKTLASVCQKHVEIVTFLDTDFIIDDEHISDLYQVLAKFGCDQKQIETFVQVITQSFKTSSGERKVNIYNVDLARLNEFFNERFKGSVKATTRNDFILLHPQDIASTLAKYALVVLDEMSMVGSELFNAFHQAIQLLENRAPVVLTCGDPGQLQPVQAKMNDAMLSAPDGKHSFLLEEILRSTDGIAQLGQFIRKGVPIDGLADFFEDAIDVIRTQQDTQSLLKSQEQKLLEADVVISYRNNVVKQANEFIRAKKITYDQLHSLQVGEPIVIKQNAGYAGGGYITFANGELYQVAKIYEPTTAIMKYFSAIENCSSHRFNIRLDVLDDEKNAIAIKEAILQKLGQADATSEMGALGYIYEGLSSRNLLMVEFISPLGATNTAIVKHDLKDDTSNIAKIAMKVMANFSKAMDGQLPYVKADFGYAVTIHKAQGSEWKNVCCILFKNDLAIAGKLNPQDRKSLPYTAVTRAKEKVKILYVV